MTASLRDNAYHVLGLTGAATSKQILQRSNEIVQRLKIDDIPEYELDIRAFGNCRTEESVKDALRRLQAPRARLLEYFFWFRFAGNVDMTASALLSGGDLEGAIETWRSGIEPAAAIARWRNLAIALTISLLGDGALPPDEHLEESLLTWSDIIDSDEFWEDFAEEYRRDAESLSDEALADFRNRVLSDLSDIYAELGDFRGDKALVSRFQKHFGTHGQKIEEGVLNPAFLTVRAAIEQIEAATPGPTPRYNRNGLAQLKAPITTIQAEFNKLIDAGLYDDSKTRLVRDEAASAIRYVSIALHNHHDDPETALKLLEISDAIAGTDSLKALIEADLNQIRKTIASIETDAISIDIPFATGAGTIVFRPNHVAYGAKKIFYKDMTRVAYNAMMRSMNLIPYSQSYRFMVASSEQTIDISWGTALYIGNEKKQNVWAQLANMATHLVVPRIVENMTHTIFVAEKSVSIGNLLFTKDGYSRGKMFGKRELVPWTEKIYAPSISAGNVMVWMNRNDTRSLFASIPMSTANAVVIPELVTACVDIVANEQQ